MNKIKMSLPNSKRSQAQIITTVLIILLVLAAIVIVWQVVSGTIDEGGKEIEAQAKCIGVSMEITNIDLTAGAEFITVRRGQGSTDTIVDGCKVFIDGSNDANCVGSLGPLDTEVIGVAGLITATSEISVAAVSGSTVCAASSKVSVDETGSALAGSSGPLFSGKVDYTLSGGNIMIRNLFSSGCTNSFIGQAIYYSGFNCMEGEREPEDEHWWTVRVLNKCYLINNIVSLDEGIPSCEIGDNSVENKVLSVNYYPCDNADTNYEIYDTIDDCEAVYIS